MERNAEDFGAPGAPIPGASPPSAARLNGGSNMAEMVKSLPTGEGAERPSPAGTGSQTKEVVSNVAGQARELVSGQVHRRAERSADDISSVAQALRQTREQLGDNFAAPVVDKAAEQLDRLSRFLRTAEPRQVVWEVEAFARREPLVFLGGAFALGMLGARFLKSSSRQGREWEGYGARGREVGSREYISGASEYPPGIGRPGHGGTAHSTVDYGSQAGAVPSYRGTGGIAEGSSQTGPRGAGERAGTGEPDIGATAPDPRGDYPPNSPPGGPYPGSGMSTVDRQDRQRRS